MCKIYERIRIRFGIKMESQIRIQIGIKTIPYRSTDFIITFIKWSKTTIFHQSGRPPPPGLKSKILKNRRVLPYSSFSLTLIKHDYRRQYFSRIWTNGLYSKNSKQCLTAGWGTVLGTCPAKRARSSLSGRWWKLTPKSKGLPSKKLT